MEKKGRVRLRQAERVTYTFKMEELRNVTQIASFKSIGSVVKATKKEGKGRGKGKGMGEGDVSRKRYTGL